MGHFLRNPGTSRAEMQTGGQKGWVVAAPAEGRSADTGLWGWGGGLDGAGRRAREAGASSLRGPGTLTPGVPSRGQWGRGGGLAELTAAGGTGGKAPGRSPQDVEGKPPDSCRGRPLPGVSGACCWGQLGTLALLVKAAAHLSHSPPSLWPAAGTRPAQGSPLPLTFVSCWFMSSAGSGGVSVSELKFLERLAGSLSPTGNFGGNFICLLPARGRGCGW